jgi:hypothetical protein
MLLQEEEGDLDLTAPKFGQIDATNPKYGQMLAAAAKLHNKSDQPVLIHVGVDSKAPGSVSSIISQHMP